MANPAFQRSGETEDGLGCVSGEEDGLAATGFAAYAAADLIAWRNQLLEECLEMENRAADADEGQDGRSNELDLVRERIDEIHQELALRDLAERADVSGGGSAGTSLPEGTRAIGRSSLSAHAARKSAQILGAIEMRSRFMDELAQAAKDKGRLDQAAAFTLNAQRLDMERVEVLCQLSALSGDETDTDD